MGRYVRLYLNFLRFSWSKALEFRLDFFFRVGMDVVWYATNLAFFDILFRHTQTLGGWNHDQVLVFIAGVFVADAVHMTLFSNNMWWFPILVNRGDLDYYLVRPVSSLFFLSLREFAANSFLNLIMAVGILVWALTRYPDPVAPGALAAYLSFLALGIFLHYVLHMVFLIPVFWLHNAHGLREVFFDLDRFTTRPHGIFRGFVYRLITTILPFALIVSFPTQMLFEGAQPGWMLYMLVVASVAFAFLVWFWRRGLRAYASASS